MPVRVQPQNSFKTCCGPSLAYSKTSTSDTPKEYLEDFRTLIHTNKEENRAQNVKPEKESARCSPSILPSRLGVHLHQEGLLLIPHSQHRDPFLDVSGDLDCTPQCSPKFPTVHLQQSQVSERITGPRDADCRFKSHFPSAPCQENT